MTAKDKAAAEEHAHKCFPYNASGDSAKHLVLLENQRNSFLAGIQHERDRMKKLVGSAYDWCENEITEWMTLLEKAHKTTPYSNPKEAEREHGNEMRLLQVIKQKIIKQRAKTIAEYEGGGE